MYGATEKMTIGNNVKEICDRNPTTMKKFGCYPCKYNILYGFNPSGLNHSFPPDILHAVLLGYVTRLIDKFVQLKQKNSESCLYFLLLSRRK